MAICARARAEDGMTLVEVLVAMLILTVGIVSLIKTFDSARKLTLVAERRASIAHLAQRELERLQSVPYSELAMVSSPSHSSESTNPDYYVNYSSPLKCKEVEGGGCFAWNAENTAEEEPLVVTKTHEKCPTTGTTEKECGVASPSPTGISCSEINPFGACEWTDGRLSGAIYDFVTYHTDNTGCSKTECPSAYKRVTVVVTVNVPIGTHKPTPVRVSTLIPNPTAAKESPLSSPGTKCDEESCVQGIDKGTARSWFLHDVEAEAVEKTSLAEAEKAIKTKTESEENQHTTHTTVGPAPAHADFMDSSSPERTALYDYSSEQNSKGFTLGTLQYGGRRIADEIGCSSATEMEGATLAANGEMWVTSPMSAQIKLTGAGGLTIYTQTVGGSAGSVTLCVAAYDVPEKVDKLWSTAETSPKLLGYASYGPVTWPTSMGSVAFVFTLQFPKGNQTVAEKHRLGLRVWPAFPGSTTPISAAYDTVSQPSIVQLNTE